MNETQLQHWHFLLDLHFFVIFDNSNKKRLGNSNDVPDWGSKLQYLVGNLWNEFALIGKKNPLQWWVNSKINPLEKMHT